MSLLVKFTTLKYYFLIFVFQIPIIYQYRFHEKQKAAYYLFIYLYLHVLQSYINKIIPVTIITSYYGEKKLLFHKKIKLLSK